jgi:predicted Zn-dependent protease with MMP-like domain
MLIGVYGSTDKRPVIYALLKLLQATGDVALFSNNRHYKRLLEQGQSQGHMANILISISDASPDEIFEEVGYNADDFEHIIFDIQDSIPDNLSLIIYVRSYAPNEDEQSFLDLLGEYTTVKMAYDGKVQKGAINVSPISVLWKTVEEIESYHLLHPLPSKNLNRGLAVLLAPHLNMTGKSALMLLNRRWGR